MAQKEYTIEQNIIQKQAAFHCAQVLAGVKASNILITTEGTEEDVALILSGTGVEYKCLWAGEDRSVYLLYRREQAEKILKNREAERFFKSFGYGSMKLSKVLLRLAERYRLYADGQREFPHEIGLILEYPIWDVEGFIQHKGRDFLFSGYWKVYKEPEEARRRFAAYTAVRELVVEETERGRRLWQICASLLGQPAHGLTAVA
ncbi:MAG: DUF3793 family protein [Clostridium sp.]|nr:DUF3793 family protein [Clostridium sp.]